MSMASYRGNESEERLMPLFRRGEGHRPTRQPIGERPDSIELRGFARRNSDGSGPDYVLIATSGPPNGPPTAVRQMLNGELQPEVTRAQQLRDNADLLDMLAESDDDAGEIVRATATQSWAANAWLLVSENEPNDLGAKISLAAAYNSLSVLKDRQGGHRDAVDEANKALRVLRPRWEDDPKRVLPIIVGVLTNMVRYLDASGQPDGAAKARADLELYRRAATNSQHL
jgi:hypothetical protein